MAATNDMTNNQMGSSEDMNKNSDISERIEKLEKNLELVSSENKTPEEQEKRIREHIAKIKANGVTHWEFGNENNFKKQEDAAAYVEVLKQIRPLLNAEAPGVKLLSIGFANGFGGVKSLEMVARAGGWPLLDGIAYHLGRGNQDRLTFFVGFHRQHDFFLAHGNDLQRSRCRSIGGRVPCNCRAVLGLAGTFEIVQIYRIMIRRVGIQFFLFEIDGCPVQFFHGQDRASKERIADHVAPRIWNACDSRGG